MSKRIALITGASSGLGSRYALELQNETDVDELWLIARSKDKLEQLKAELKKPAKVIALDLADDSSYGELESLIAAEAPDIRWFINNAGRGSYGDFVDMDINSQKAICDLNCKAFTLVSLIALKVMKSGSRVINVCSIASFVPNTSMAVYSSSKAYVLSFSRGVREELKKRKISMLAVCPGPMTTGFFDAAGVNGQTKSLETLPRCDVEKTAKNSIKAAKKNRAVYTPTLLYKAFRVLAKLLPKCIMIKIAKA